MFADWMTSEVGEMCMTAMLGAAEGCAGIAGYQAAAARRYRPAKKALQSAACSSIQ